MISAVSKLTLCIRLTLILDFRWRRAKLFESFIKLSYLVIKVASLGLLIDRVVCLLDLVPTDWDPS